MRHFPLVQSMALRAATVCSASAVVVSSYPSSRPSACALTHATRWQSQTRSSQGSGGGGGAGRSDYAARSGVYRRDGSPAGSHELNSTKDGLLSWETRAAMRDDSIILSAIFKHLPKEGAVSLKALFATLAEEVQEALTEGHGGLRSFLEQRKQIFTVRPSPTDGVLYVVGNPIVAQQFATKDAQRRTLEELMGLNADGTAQNARRGGGGSNFGSRGRGRGGHSGGYQGGSNTRREHNSGSGGRGGYGDRRRPPPQQQQQQRDGRRLDEGGNRYGGSRGGRGGRHAGGPPRSTVPLGTTSHSYGTGK